MPTKEVKEEVEVYKDHFRRAAKAMRSNRVYGTDEAVQEYLQAARMKGVSPEMSRKAAQAAYNSLLGEVRNIELKSERGIGVAAADNLAAARIAKEFWLTEKAEGSDDARRERQKGMPQTAEVPLKKSLDLFESLVGIHTQPSGASRDSRYNPKAAIRTLEQMFDIATEFKLEDKVHEYAREIVNMSNSYVSWFKRNSMHTKALEYQKKAERYEYFVE